MDQSKDVNRAKELFWYYKGNTYQMYRNGIYDEYEKYEISTAVEWVWRREYADETLNILDNESDPEVIYMKFLSAVELSVTLNDITIFNKLRIYSVGMPLLVSKFYALVMMEQLLKSCANFPTEAKPTATVVLNLIDKILMTPIKEDHIRLLASGYEDKTTAEEIEKRFLVLKNKCNEIFLENP